MDPRVLDSMLPFYLGRFGNPHSRTHSFGWETETAIENSRQQIADLIGASSKEIIFTSGATESNNMAIKGRIKVYTASFVIFDPLFINLMCFVLHYICARNCSFL